MFRFVYALAPDEPADTRWGRDGFVGIETAAPREGLPWVGVRGVPADRPSESGPISAVNALVQYVIHPAAGRDATAAPFGRSLRETADRLGVPGPTGPMLLIESGGAFSTPHALWGLMEAAGHPRVKVSFDLDALRAAGESAAVMIPTINLRIGLVRVSTPHDDLVGYARRLAGIGFGGFVVIDPPAGPDRATRAEALAAAFRGVFPSKPAKKAATLKPT